jgi:hypothetical protein
MGQDAITTNSENERKRPLRPFRFSGTLRMLLRGRSFTSGSDQLG